MAMSKLDFITMLIVAICVGALGFLVYKTVRLMNPTDGTTTEVSEQKDTTTYDPADDYTLDDEGDVVSDDTPASGESSEDVPATAEDFPVTEDAADQLTEKEETATKTPEKTTPTSYNESTKTGAYMVLAGSYKQKINASNQVSKLKKMGYDEAAVELFNGGALAVALVNRFDSYNEAAKLKKELESKGFDVFIKKK